MHSFAPLLTRRTCAGLFALPVILLVCLVALSLGAPAPARAAGTIYYVNAATGDDLADGTSWDTAYETLQTALALANNGDEIWVAAGTYYPDDGFTLLPPPDNPRAITFILRSDIDIYGGFPATGDPDFADRDPDAHVTILSGDIDENDSASPVTDPATQIVGKNAYHVVVALATNPGQIPLLDGLTITAGEAESISAYAHGGGM